jgi:hypothetical protein
MCKTDKSANIEKAFAWEKEIPQTVKNFIWRRAQKSTWYHPDSLWDKVEVFCKNQMLSMEQAYLLFERAELAAETMGLVASYR